MFTTGLVIGDEQANFKLIIGGLATGFLVFILIVIIIWLLKRNEEREFQRKHKVKLENQLVLTGLKRKPFGISDTFLSL